MSKLYKKNLIYGLYFVVLSVLAIYSYSLIDLNLTLFNHPWWNSFRSFIIQIGYFNRGLSMVIYGVLIVSLFILQYLAIKLKADPMKLIFIIGGICLLAYPFLSHDFFNYIFYTKILLVYQKNPYLYKPLDFPGDQWLRFMHWTHAPYPYGPLFLLVILIPALLSFGKFALNYFMFKLMFVFFYFLMVYLLNKINKKWALIMAVNPLIIIEGLVSPHNDLIGLSLAITGIYFVFKEKNFLGRLFIVISGGIKYVTLPLIILSKTRRIFNVLAMLGIIFGIAYVSYKLEIQPWYFLSLFAFLPFFPDLINRLNIFFAGLLFSYYPYIYLGGWDKPEKVLLKRQIMLVFFALNLLYLFVYFFLKKIRQVKGLQSQK